MCKYLVCKTIIYSFRKRDDHFKSNKEAAEHLKKILDDTFYWLEWIVIAYNNKNKNERDENSAYYKIKMDGYLSWEGSRGMLKFNYQKNISFL